MAGNYSNRRTATDDSVSADDDTTENQLITLRSVSKRRDLLVNICERVGYWIETTTEKINKLVAAIIGRCDPIPPKRDE